MLSLDVATACTLPNLFFVRTGYAARALRKLLNICDSQAEFEGRSHIDVKDLKFEEYLNAIIALLSRIHAESSSTVARAFGMVLTQILTQALESSKLLSSIKRVDKSNGVDANFDPDSDFLIGSKEPFNHPCLQLGRIPDPQPSDAHADTIYGDPDTLGSQNVAVEAPPHQPGFDATQWQSNDSNDAFMSGIDVLQWFEQDFALNAGTFEYDGMSLPPAHWQQ